MHMRISTITTGGWTRRFVWAAAIAVLIAVGARVVRAFNPQPDPPGTYAMVGINPQETLRLFVVNISGTNGIPPGPCNVQLGFMDASGQVVKSTGGTLAPGQAGGLSITFAEVPTKGDAAAAGRVAVHPVWDADVVNGCYAASSAEVFDSRLGTGHMHIAPSIQHIAPPAPTTAN
jgi:hypothetical protein